MTARERIDAAIAARPQATPGPLKVVFKGAIDKYVVEKQEGGVHRQLAYCGYSDALLFAAAPDLVDEVIRLRADNAELEALFSMQYKRTTEATKAWRKANPGNDNVMPDLGNLLTWMLGEMARLRKWQQEALPWIWREQAGRRIFREPTAELDRLIAEAKEER